MENLDFEFIDRAISALKEKDKEGAARIIYDNQDGLSLSESRIFISLIHQMTE